MKNVKPTVLFYCVDRQAWQNNSGADTLLMITSDHPNVVQMRGTFPQMNWTYSDYFKGAEVLSRLEFRKKFNYTGV